MKYLECDIHKEDKEILDNSAWCLALIDINNIFQLLISTKVQVPRCIKHSRVQRLTDKRQDKSQ